MTTNQLVKLEVTEREKNTVLAGLAVLLVHTELKLEKAEKSDHQYSSPEAQLQAIQKLKDGIRATKDLIVKLEPKYFN